MKPWQLGDGDNTVQTPELRMEFIYDRINNELLAAGINDPTTFAAFATYLGYGSGGCTYQDMQVAWTPTNLKLGERLGFITNFDTTTSLPGITSLIINYATVRDGIYIQSASDLVSVVFPSLVSCTGDAQFSLKTNPVLTTVTANALVTVEGFGFDINGHPSLTSISFNSLASVLQGGTSIRLNTSLPTLSLPLLSSSFNGLACDGNSALVTVSIPSLIPVNGDTLNFSGAALSAASVDHILAVCVAAAGFTSGTIRTDGGTSAAPSSTAPGSDYAVLVARGLTVTVNP